MYSSGVLLDISCTVIAEIFLTQGSYLPVLIHLTFVFKAQFELFRSLSAQVKPTESL